MTAMPPPTEGEAIRVEWPEDGVCLVRMTRAKEMNTLSLALLTELAAAFDAATAAKARTLVITGSGRAFCCGAHLKYFTDPASPIGRLPTEVRDNYLTPIALLFDRIETLPFPVIAAINGYALGGGCEMALACDFRLIADSARIGVPEVKLGATPGAGGVQKLQRFVGRGKALEWILLGTHVTPEEAERRGLVTEVTAPDALLPAAMALARRIKALSPMALAQAKASVHVSADTDLRSARRYGLEALALLVGSPDWQEGMAAFVEKREPRF